jgi:hypothetical protein
MADNQFDILIKFISDPTKAKEAAAELKKIEEQTKATGKENVKQEKEGKEATDKSTESKKRFKEALKGLQIEFPVLGRLAALAINPIGAAVALATGSFVALKAAIQQSEESLSGFNIPEITDSVVERAGKFAEKIAQIAEASSKAKSQLSELQQTIQANADFWTALGMDLGQGPAIAKADAASSTAAGLEQAARANMAAGMNVSDSDLAKLGVAATAAEATLKGQAERQAWLDEHKAGKKSAFQFAWRYGFNTSTDEAQAAENQKTAQAQAAIDRYTNTSAGRDRYRLGLSQMREAEGILVGNVQERRSIANTTAGQMAGNFSAMGNSGIAMLPSDFAVFFKSVLELQAQLRAATAELDARTRVGRQAQ